MREGLADALFTRLSTPIGRLLVVHGPEGLVRIAFESEAEDVALAEVAGALGPERDRLRPRAGGRAGRAARATSRATHALDLPVDLRLTARAVPARGAREAARRCRAGETVSYGELAARAGNPQGGPRRRHGVRAQPGPDRRALPPRAPGHGQARQLRAAGRSASARCWSSEARLGLL